MQGLPPAGVGMLSHGHDFSNSGLHHLSPAELGARRLYSMAIERDGRI